MGTDIKAHYTGMAREQGQNLLKPIWGDIIATDIQMHDYRIRHKRPYQKSSAIVTNLILGEVYSGIVHVCLKDIRDDLRGLKANVIFTQVKFPSIEIFAAED